MPRITRDIMPLLVAKAATGIGNSIQVKDYRHVYLQFTAALNSSLTVKFAGSLSNTIPDFSAAQSETNIWDYIAVYDLNTPDLITDGDTGIVINNDTVANNIHQFHVNTEILRWFCPIVTAYNDGNVTVNAVGALD